MGGIVGSLVGSFVGAGVGGNGTHCDIILMFDSVPFPTLYLSARLLLINQTGTESFRKSDRVPNFFFVAI